MVNRIDVIVDWWADKLVACKFSGLSELERQDPVNNGYQMAEIMMAKSKQQANAEQIELFKGALRTALFKQLQSPNSRSYSLDVDYHPCEALATSLQAAGLDPSLPALPIKTYMRITDEVVEVSYGYGSPMKVIWKQE